MCVHILATSHVHFCNNCVQSKETSSVNPHSHSHTHTLTHTHMHGYTYMHAYTQTHTHTIIHIRMLPHAHIHNSLVDYCITHEDGEYMKKMYDAEKTLHQDNYFVRQYPDA